MSNMGSVWTSTPSPASGSGHFIADRMAHPRRPIGLRNLGNTCYQNSVLQVLLNDPIFMTSLKRLQRRSYDVNNPEVAAAFITVAKKIRSARTGSRSAVRAHEVRDAMGRINGDWKNSLQQDSAEFLTSLLKALPAGMLVPQAAAASGSSASATTCPLTPHTAAEVEITCTCHRCGFKTVDTELELGPISVGMPVTVNTTVQEMMAKYCKGYETTIPCQCSPDGSVPHTVRRRFARLPRLLAVHVDRVAYVTHEAAGDSGPTSTQVKLNTRIDVTAELDMSSYCVAKAHTDVSLSPRHEVPSPATPERSERSAAYMSPDVGATPASIRSTVLRGALLPSPLAPPPFNVEVIDFTATSSAIGQEEEEEEEEDNMEASEFPGEDSDLPDELFEDLPNPDDLLRLQTCKRRADCLVTEDDPKREEGALRKRRRIIGCFGNKTSSDHDAADGAAGTTAQMVLLPAGKVAVPWPNRPGKLLGGGGPARAVSANAGDMAEAIRRSLSEQGVVGPAMGKETDLDSDLEEAIRRSLEDANGMETNEEDEAVEMLDEDEEMEEEDHDVIASGASSSTPLARAGNYHLHGVVRHRGLTPLEGHYTVDLQMGNQVWCHHDDSRVTEVDLKTVLQKAGEEGHIFYQHSARPACSSLSA